LQGDGRVSQTGRNVRQLPVTSSRVLLSETAIGVPDGTSSIVEIRAIRSLNHEGHEGHEGGHQKRILLSVLL
jgi:hypothetical protein